MKNKSYSPLIFGLAIIGIGIVLMLHYLNIVIDFPDWLISWRTFIVLVGISFVAEGRKVGFGIILIIIGATFLARDFIPYDLRKMLWPALMILGGAYIIFKHYLRKDNDLESGIFNQEINIQNQLNELSIFGGSKVNVNGKDFSGGKITTIFGGSEIDLRDAKPAGKVIVIDILTMFGGAELRVPENWNVKTQNTPIFGGVDDKRRSMNPEVEFETTLVIKGITIFGGMEIRN